MTGASGYATLYAIEPATPLLSPYYTGAELAGGDRGAVLRVGQQSQPTALQASCALTANGASGYAVTLPKASAPLVFSFTNIDVVPINIFACPGTNPYVAPNDPIRLWPDSINGQPNNQPLVLAAGASITMTGARGAWSS